MELNGLETEFLGKNLIFFDSIDSTQKRIKALKAPVNGTIIIADNQTDGIGTHDRKWYSGTENNIAMSFVLLPCCNIKKIENLTINVAKCMAKVLKKICKSEFEIKPPNDIFYNGKKIGGILTECVCKGENVEKIYIGIGLNVNQDIFPGKLSDTATSLKLEFGKNFEREKIIKEFLKEFEKKYKKMINN